MQRYFSISNDVIKLDDTDVHHILNVMRGRIKDQFEIVFNNKIYLMEITNTKPLEYQNLKTYSSNAEMPCKLTLILAPVKGGHLEFALQKATELGVDEIIFLNTKYGVVKIDESKLGRYNRILKEASEQSKRTSIPKLNRIINIIDIKDIKTDYRYIAYEKEYGGISYLINDMKKNKIHNPSISFVIGPEGGFSKEEFEEIRSYGYASIQLGNRILRTETAVCYLCSIFSFLFEGN